MKLSAVIITKNEEKNIARCLDSLQGLVDEIIVVDSYSTDRTKDICSKYNSLTFVEQKWLGYSEQKNFGNTIAENEMILSLDADEAITPKLKKEIQALTDENKVYGFPRLTNYCGKWIYHSGWYPDVQWRIFPKSKAKWNQAPVHEVLEFKDLEKVKLKHHIEHYSVYSIEQHIDTINKYSSLNAYKILAKSKTGLLTKALFRSIHRFIKIYFLKKAFLDGAEGFYIAGISAYSVFLKYVKAHQKSRNPS